LSGARNQISIHRLPASEIIFLNSAIPASPRENFRRPCAPRIPWSRRSVPLHCTDFSSPRSPRLRVKPSVSVSRRPSPGHDKACPSIRETCPVSALLLRVFALPRFNQPCPGILRVAPSAALSASPRLRNRASHALASLRYSTLRPGRQEAAIRWTPYLPN